MTKNLTPVRITDKNGRATTVYRKPEKQQTASVRIPPVAPSPAPDADSRDKYRQILESMQPGLEKRRLEKEYLESGAEEKDEVISRLAAAYREPEKVNSLTKHRETQYVESLRSLESLVLREPFQNDFATEALRRYSTLTGETFRKWTALAERHYDTIVASPIADTKTTVYLPGLFSAGIYEIDCRKHETGHRITEQQEYNYLILNLAARDSNLEGTRIREGSGWGLITCLNNKELTAFAMTCTDTERLHRICAVIKNTPVTRFTEAVAIADGNAIGTLASGAL